MIGIINYGVGNLTSVKNACAAAGCEAEFVMKPEDLKKYSHLLLPGVGAFGECVEQFSAHGFTRDQLQERLAVGVPLLGICVGMQMLATVGEEFGLHDGLNLIPGRVVRFSFTEPRVPHVGWNDVVIAKPNSLFLPEDDLHFYFVHSYHFVPENKEDVVATCDYGPPAIALSSRPATPDGEADGGRAGDWRAGGSFVASVGNGLIYGTQFHPEKSFPTGLKVLKRFSEIKT